MQTEYIAHGYVGMRHDNELYLVGRVLDWEHYQEQPGDILLPSLGGMLVPEELRQAIINGTFTGRLVPYEMTKEYYVVDEAMLRFMNPHTERLVIRVDPRSDDETA